MKIVFDLTDFLKEPQVLSFVEHILRTAGLITVLLYQNPGTYQRLGS